MYISVDIGGTNTRVALFKSLKKPRIIKLDKFETSPIYSDGIQKIIDSIANLKTERKVEKLVVGIPSKVDKTRSFGLHFTNISDWTKKHIRKDLEEKLKIKVIIENDAALAAIGEALYGAGENKSFFFIIWGTGVGGAKIINEYGKIDCTPLEPGHETIIKKDGRLGACGHRGDLSAYTSGASIKKYYHKSAEDISEKDWDEIINNFSQGIVLLSKEKNLKSFIFGGGIAIKNPDKILAIQKKASKQIPKIQLQVSKLGDDTALYGGIGLLRMLGQKN